MSIWGIFQKHGKIERYEKQSESMAKIIPFTQQQEKKKGLEELKFIDITHPAKKSARSANR